MPSADSLQMRFRSATADDVARLWALRTRCVRELCCSHYPAQIITVWSASPPPRRYAALLAAGGGVLAEDADGQLLGFAVLDAAENELDALFVDPDRGGLGIGAALLQQALARADPHRDMVLSASLNAVSFYLRQGFVAEREEGYAHPSGVVLASMRMRRPRH